MLYDKKICEQTEQTETREKTGTHGQTPTGWNRNGLKPMNNLEM